MRKKAPKIGTLRRFATEKRKKDCALCKLPAKVLKELHVAHDDITVAIRMEWLQSLGYNITPQQYLTHARAGHHLRR